MGFFSPGNRFLFAAQNAIIAGMKRFRDIFLFLLFAFVFSAFSYSLPQKKRTSRNVFSESKSVNSESDFFTESEEEVSSLSAGEENLLKSIAPIFIEAEPPERDFLLPYEPEIHETPESVEIASLAVKTNVPNARVFIDGVYAGFSPVFVKWIEVGPHKISAYAPGYEPESQVFHVLSGKSNSCYLTMERMKGILIIQSDQADCQYYCDGVLLSSNMNIVEEGFHVVKIRKFGYRDFSARVFVPSFRIKRIYVNLEEAPFELVSLSASRGAFNPSYSGNLGECEISAYVTSKGSGEVLIFDPENKVVFKKKFPSFRTWKQAFLWDGSDEYGQKLPEGSYVVTFNAEGKSLSTRIRLDYSVKYPLYDFTPGGLGFGTVPAALSVPASSVYIGMSIDPSIKKDGSLESFPLGFYLDYAPIKGLSFDIGTKFYLDKGTYFYEGGDGRKRQGTYAMVDFSMKYAGTVAKTPSMSLNMGLSLGYGYSNLSSFSPYGIAYGRGLNGAFLLGLDFSKIFSGFTTQIFLDGREGGAFADEIIWKNALALSASPIGNLSLNAWAAIHSLMGKENSPFRGFETGVTLSMMVPYTSLYLTGGYLMYLYSGGEMYNTLTFGVKYIFN